MSLFISSKQSVVCQNPHIPCLVRTDTLDSAFWQTTIIACIVATTEATIMIAHMTNATFRFVHPDAILFYEETFKSLMRIAIPSKINEAFLQQVVAGIVECNRTQPHQLVLLVNVYRSHVGIGLTSPYSHCRENKKGVTIITT